jgi:hypothetical protein
MSRAISLLGFDNVKTTALAMLLVDALASSDHAYSVRWSWKPRCAPAWSGARWRATAFTRAPRKRRSARCSRISARCWWRPTSMTATAKIQALLASGKHKLAQAAQMILGCSYDALSEAVLGEWKIPDVIMRAQRPLETGGAGRIEAGRQPRRMDAPGGVVQPGRGAPAGQGPPRRPARRKRRRCWRATAMR